MANVVLAQIILPPPADNPRYPHNPSDGGGSTPRDWGYDISAREARVRPRLVKTLSGFQHPESTLVTKDAIFVSDMGKSTDSDKMDGMVYKFDLNGVLDSNFNVKTELKSPMGMTIIGQQLYIVDMDRVVVLSVENGDMLKEYDFRHLGASFLNDIVAVGSRYLYVTATNLKKVFIVDIYTGLINNSDLDLMSAAPNGITYDSYRSQLYISANRVHSLGEEGNGLVISYNLNSSNRSYINEMRYIGKFIDGITFKRNNLIVSDWVSRQNEGKLYYLNRYTLKLNATHEMNTAGLADISYDRNAELLVNPDLVHGRVYIYK